MFRVFRVLFRVFVVFRVVYILIFNMFKILGCQNWDTPGIGFYFDIV